MAAKVTASKQPAKRAPARRAPVRPALLAGQSDEEVEGLEIGADGLAVLHIPDDDGQEAEPERIPMFTIGGREYTVLLEPPTSIAVEALHIMAAGGGGPQAQLVADDYVMTQMLGEDAYAALRQSKKVTSAQRRWVSMEVSRRAMGALEDPKL